MGSLAVFLENLLPWSVKACSVPQVLSRLWGRFCGQNQVTIIQYGMDLEPGRQETHTAVTVHVETTSKGNILLRRATRESRSPYVQIGVTPKPIPELSIFNLLHGIRNLNVTYLHKLP